MIVVGDLETTIQRRVEWANARAKRIKFLNDLKGENYTGKEYSAKVVDYDRKHMRMSWAA